MKLWYGAFALTTAILILALVIETPAQQQSSKPATGRCEVVVLNATLVNIPTVAPLYAFKGYDGVGVYCSSSSTGAPNFGNYVVANGGVMVSYAESMAQLKSAGYTCFFISKDGQTSMWEKR